MSLQGNIAIEGYIDELEAWIAEHKNDTDFAEKLANKLAADKKSAQSGWL